LVWAALLSITLIIDQKEAPFSIRITKTYIKQVQPSSPLITTSVLGGTLAHRLNISSGLAVDLTRYLYVQFQVDETYYYEQIKTDIKELRTDVYLKLGVGIRI